MKKLLFILMFLMGSIQFGFAYVYVHGYFRSNGTYVAPHYRSDPDGNPYNNFSTRGNINPFTGQPGYKDPYNW